VADDPDGCPLLYCANPDCRLPLTADHVILITTRHLRRFCGLPCVVKGYELSIERWMRE